LRKAYHHHHHHQLPLGTVRFYSVLSVAAALIYYYCTQKIEKEFSDEVLRILSIQLLIVASWIGFSDL
jgi:hypothetical protein